MPENHDYQDIKQRALAYCDAMAAADPSNVEAVLRGFTAPGYHCYAVHPFGRLEGEAAVAENLWQPLMRDWSSLKRRPFMFMAGTSEIDQTQWVISAGVFMGLLDGNWLGIPATGRLTTLRYAEFLGFAEGRITRSAFFCDIIDVMQQARVSPLPASLGASQIFPAPLTQDGLLFDRIPPEQGTETLNLIDRMVDDLKAINANDALTCPPDYLRRTWHEDMAWYGPAGIGATFTIERYQQQHQHPFRFGVKDKEFNGHICRLAEGNYGGFFGWPNLRHVPAGGFLGLPGANKAVEMRVVDLYRRSGDKLAENWIIIDFPWWLKQQGLDVFTRLKELTPGS
ncbi:MAG: nuclear transport factor 2 family protein [Pseudomonadota bacterium]